MQNDQNSPTTPQAASSEPRVKFSSNLALLWLAQFVSSLGDWCLWIAVPITVYNRTDSRIDLAFTFFTEGLPYLLFSPIAGVIVDRLDRRKVMIASDIGRAALVAVLAIPRATPLPLWEVYVVLFFASSLSAFFGPARIVVMTQLVPLRQLLRVNAILSSSIQLSEAAGPAIGALIFAGLGQSRSFIADSISFLVSAACIGALAVKAMPPRRDSPLTVATGIEDLKAGARQILKASSLRGLLVAWNVGYFATAIFLSMVYAFARDSLHLGAEHYGLMMSCMGAGFLVGGLAIGVVLHRRQPAELIVVGLILSAISAAGIATAHTLLVAETSLGAFGFGAILVNIPAQTLVQTLVSQDMLGRFSGAFSMAARASQIAGMAAAGLIASHFSLSDTYSLVGVLYAASALLAIVLILNSTIAARSRAPSAVQSCDE